MVDLASQALCQTSPFADVPMTVRKNAPDHHPVLQDFSLRRES
jgi:hypothetical protein